MVPVYRGSRLAPLQSRPRGFTLIELLVVIAIISILAGILLPVFAQAREKGRQAACNSNEGQILIAFTMYTQDYDERYPPAFSTTPSGANISWCQEIYSGVRAQGVFQCLSDPDNGINNFAGSGWVTNPPPPGITPPFHSSYEANYQVLQTGNTLSAIQNPSSTVLLAEGSSKGLSSPAWDGSWIGGSKPTAFILDDPQTDTYCPQNSSTPCGPTAVDGTDPSWGAPDARHLGWVNVGFCDGHVKGMRPEVFYHANSDWLNPAKGGSN